MIVLYPFYSLFNGYISARFYRLWNGSNWLVCGFLASTILPGFLISCLLVIDLCEYIETRRTSFPVSDVFILIVLWLAVNMPITMLGSFYGYSIKTIEVPCQPNRVERSIPK